jgi:hypothetical protein
MFRNLFSQFSELSAHKVSLNCSHSSFEAHFFRTRQTKLFSYMMPSNLKIPGQVFIPFFLPFWALLSTGQFLEFVSYCLCLLAMFSSFISMSSFPSPERFSSQIAFFSWVALPVKFASFNLFSPLWHGSFVAGSFDNLQIQTLRSMHPRLFADELSIALNIIALKRVARGSKSVTSFVSSLQMFGLGPSVPNVAWPQSHHLLWTRLDWIVEFQFSWIYMKH